MEIFERARLDAYFARIAARFARGEQTVWFLIPRSPPSPQSTAASAAASPE
ncbi:hypothetical protein [Streptomyces roseochromogenus]|uniref:Uncharacterized protein n=1 Tax=Streptomyces roseochromogenus subsp. oscitans DS 12.976 TaxID=1352936 RepID=V6JG55_STRRC|nr:hypothetical protein [Streptomyces roseochromogenus]EST18887.1 hypothetical protein M878_44025 [Streptomyces roseochromogenus subsp. oscitans DS 12.976]